MQEQEDKDEKSRIDFLNSLERIRRSRKHFRGLLYDAISQRDGVLKSYEMQKVGSKMRVTWIAEIKPPPHCATQTQRRTASGRSKKRKLKDLAREWIILFSHFFSCNW